MMEDEAKEEDSMMQEDEMMEEDSVPGDDAMMDNKGSYVPFTPEVLASAASRRRVLYFYANWCPTCIPADANFKANTSKIPEDVTLIRVNYNDTDTDDTERALAVKYGITYQHTFVQIDGSGNEVSKWNGGQIKELLDHLI
jgi:thiol-disulfide isomerase/thioredoxin